MHSFRERLRALWRSLTPSERKKLRLAGGLTASVVVSIMIRVFLAAGISVGAGYTGYAIAGGGASSPTPVPAVPIGGHANLRDELPPALEHDPVAAAEAAIAAQEAAMAGTSGPDEVSDPRTLAEPEQRGCRSGPWVQNRDSRNGARPAMAQAHLTVSKNRPGWTDVDAIAAWFNNPRSQASSHYIVDAEGNCAYIVNEAYKAWTQGWFNPWSISIEFVHFSTTDPSEPWTEAQLRKGALVMADVSRRWGIPIRLVNPEGCNVSAGITDHDRLECQNTHVDVGTREGCLFGCADSGVHRGTFPMTKFLAYVREAAGVELVWTVNARRGDVVRRLRAGRPAWCASELVERDYRVISLRRVPSSSETRARPTCSGFFRTH
jgi:hypothetical protein